MRDRFKNIQYSGHHNAGPLHLAADVAVIGTVAGTVGIAALVIVLVVILAVILVS